MLWIRSILNLELVLKDVWSGWKWLGCVEGAVQEPLKGQHVSRKSGTFMAMIANK